jgi:hypothetical protein
MAETRKIVAILGADIVGHSRLAGADKGRTHCRGCGGLRSDPIDPAGPATPGGRSLSR